MKTVYQKNEKEREQQEDIHIWTEEKVYRFICDCLGVEELTAAQMERVISLLKSGL